MQIGTDLSSVVGIRLPVGFNISAHDAVNTRVSKYLDSHPNQWGSYAAGWNAVAYRARSAADYDEEFTRSVIQANSPAHEERLLQEQALFGFFVCGLATLESFHFGAYCFASIVDPINFPIQEAKNLRITARSVADKFSTVYPAETISVEMSACLADPYFLAMENYRNALAHRGTSPRRFFRGGELDGNAVTPSNPKEIASNWRFDLSVDDRTTRQPAEWLMGVLSRLLVAAEQFCNAKL
jgi:hypothetical protein